MSGNRKVACRICKKPTPVRFGIDFKAVPICEGCANSITVQQVQDLVSKNKEPET